MNMQDLSDLEKHALNSLSKIKSIDTDDDTPYEQRLLLEGSTEVMQRYLRFSSEFDYFRTFLIDKLISFSTPHEVGNFVPRLLEFFFLIGKDLGEIYEFMFEKIRSIYPHDTPVEKIHSIFLDIIDLFTVTENTRIINRVSKSTDRYFLNILDTANAENYLQVIENVEELGRITYEIYLKGIAELDNLDVDSYKKIYKNLIKDDPFGSDVRGRIDSIKRKYNKATTSENVYIPKQETQQEAFTMTILGHDVTLDELDTIDLKSLSPDKNRRDAIKKAFKTARGFLQYLYNQHNDFNSIEDVYAYIKETTESNTWMLQDKPHLNNPKYFGIQINGSGMLKISLSYTEQLNVDVSIVQES